MHLIKLSFSGNELKYRGVCIATKYPIIDACIKKGIIVVLMDADTNPGKSKSFKNLVGYKQNGQLAWAADLPITEYGDGADCYLSISSTSKWWFQPILAESFSCHTCRINPKTGKIIEQGFHK